MKRIGTIGLLILIFMALIAMLIRCESHQETYSEKCDKALTAMPSPVVILGIHDTWAGYSVTLMDGSGHVETFGDMSTIANTIGQSRHIGDTIK